MQIIVISTVESLVPRRGIGDVLVESMQVCREACSGEVWTLPTSTVTNFLVEPQYSV
jgi:hypothetical protein